MSAPPPYGRPGPYGPPGPQGPGRPYGQPPAGYGSPYGQGQSGYGPQPGRRPMHKNNNGIIAGFVAAVIILGGVGTTVALASNSKRPTPQVNGVLSARPSGVPSGASGLPSGASGLPSGASGLPSGAVSPPGGTVPTDTVSTANSTDEFSADSAGYDYFDDLDVNDYDSSRDLFCDPSTFPLTTNDVAAVETAYADGPSTGTGSTATMSGTVNLNDGTDRAVTIYLDEQPDSTWCIGSQTSS